MQVNIKVHSSLSNYFSSLNMSADLNHYMDVFNYLQNMHPKFINYIRTQRNNDEILESFVFLDSNYNSISTDDFFFKKFKENETIHIVPSIYGGGGKRGGILAVLAAVAFFAFLPILAPAAAAAAGAAGMASTGIAGGLAIAGNAIAGTALGTAVGLSATGVASFLGQTLLTVGLAVVASLFAPEPTEPEQTRQNDAFGSLSNTTSSGTPISLHYGMVRAAGQLISGYIESVKHTKADTVSVYSVLRNRNNSGKDSKGTLYVGGGKTSKSYDTHFAINNPTVVNLTLEGTIIDVSYSEYGEYAAVLTDSNRVYMLVCNSRFSIVNGSIADFYDIAEDTNATAIYMEPYGQRLFIAGNTNKRIYQYSMTYPYDLNFLSLEVEKDLGVVGDYYSLYLDNGGTIITLVTSASVYRAACERYDLSNSLLDVRVLENDSYIVDLAFTEDGSYTIALVAYMATYDTLFGTLLEIALDLEPTMVYELYLTPISNKTRTTFFTRDLGISILGSTPTAKIDLTKLFSEVTGVSIDPKGMRTTIMGTDILTNTTTGHEFDIAYSTDRAALSEYSLVSEAVPIVDGRVGKR